MKLNFSKINVDSLIFLITCLFLIGGSISDSFSTTNQTTKQITVELGHNSDGIPSQLWIKAITRRTKIRSVHRNPANCVYYRSSNGYTCWATRPMKFSTNKVSAYDFLGTD